MPHFSDESNARWRVGIIRRKFHVGLKKKKSSVKLKFVEYVNDMGGGDK